MSDKLFNLRISYTCSPLINKRTVGSIPHRFWQVLDML